MLNQLKSCLEKVLSMFFASDNKRIDRVFFYFLRAISQVGFDPVQRFAVNVEVQMKTLQEDLMINPVKGCEDIEECKKGQVRSVNSCAYIYRYIREQ